VGGQLYLYWCLSVLLESVSVKSVHNVTDVIKQLYFEPEDKRAVSGRACRMHMSDENVYTFFCET